MIKNKVRTCREKLGYTQADLADKTNLSIRTIQRVESGETTPKGHTLKILAEVLGIEKSELLSNNSSSESIPSSSLLDIKLINLSALFFIAIPFGNIFIPFYLWDKKKEDAIVDDLGRRILSFQIIWTICTSLLLIISPFLQDFFPFNFLLILFVLLLAMCINIFFIVKIAVALNSSEYDILPLKIRLL